MQKYGEQFHGIHHPDPGWCWWPTVSYHLAGKAWPNVDSSEATLIGGMRIRSDMLFEDRHPASIDGIFEDNLAAVLPQKPLWLGMRGLQHYTSTMRQSLPHQYWNAS